MSPVNKAPLTVDDEGPPQDDLGHVLGPRQELHVHHFGRLQRALLDARDRRRSPHLRRGIARTHVRARERRHP